MEEVSGASLRDRATHEPSRAGSALRVGIPSAACIGFTGTQEGCNSSQLANLAVWLDTLARAGFEWMRNGDCVGADAEAGRIWRDACQRKLFLHPPVVRSKRAFLAHDDATVTLPYLERNEDIVDASAILIATPAQMREQRRGGTWYTIRYARRRMRPHIIIWPDGSYTLELGVAQAIEARRAETLGSVGDESAVRQDAPNSSSPAPEEGK